MTPISANSSQTRPGSFTGPNVRQPSERNIGRTSSLISTRQAGQIMQAAAFLKQTPKPSDQQIVDAMSGNICRCGTYQRVRQAIKSAAEAV
jgi:hypothetical protein